VLLDNNSAPYGRSGAWQKLRILCRTRAHRICIRARSYALRVATGSKRKQQELLDWPVRGFFGDRVPSENAPEATNVCKTPFLCRMMNVAELAFCEVRAVGGNVSWIGFRVGHRACREVALYPF